MKKTIISLGLILLIVIFSLFSCSKITDFERGKKFMELGDYDNAIKSFESAIWNQPDNPDVRYHLAQALEKSGDRRKSYRQYLFAAKIGSKEISDRFAKWAWELHDNGDGNVADIAKLAIIANEKNADAQFLYGVYQGYSGLPFLRDALDWSSNKKIVEPTFNLFKHRQAMLTNAFIEHITRAKDGFEEFGPIVFNPGQDEIVWLRAKQDHRGRYQTNNINLCARALSDTITAELSGVGTYVACPICTPDSLIYYSDGSRIYLYDRKENTTARLMPGSFPDITGNGELLALTHDWNIFISDTSGKNPKPLTQARRYYEYNFMPKFISPKDSIIIFLSYRDNYLGFYQVDTSGSGEKRIAAISRYGFNSDRPWFHAYDISPDGKNIAFSRDNQLYFLDIETGKEDTLSLFGAYPTFSLDGKKLIILTREYGETGEIASINLDEVFEAKKFFQNEKADRGKLLKLLKKATRHLEKEKFEID